MEYRQFWKPEKVNVMLLAESHVYTDEQDFEIRLNGSILNRAVPGYPLRFVRFVYCLGYGENELLSRTGADRRNAGTPQYWKIFSSCVADNGKDLGFRRILKTGVSSLQLRLRNKIDILRGIMEKGVWLVDASMMGLYGSGKKNYTIKLSPIEDFVYLTCQFYERVEDPPMSRKMLHLSLYVHPFDSQSTHKRKE